LAGELTNLVRGTSTERAVVFIDDFSYVRLDDQADVLDYLHQVVKNTGIWLKVGGVGTRMRPFRNADPPVGMQPSQDIDPLTIDVTLSDFSTAQRFLERMMDGILKPIEQSTARLFTETARTRMVLATPRPSPATCRQMRWPRGLNSVEVVSYVEYLVGSPLVACTWEGAGHGGGV
jgi:hypothetical protein